MVRVLQLSLVVVVVGTEVGGVVVPGLGTQAPPTLVAVATAARATRPVILAIILALL